MSGEPWQAGAKLRVPVPTHAVLRRPDLEKRLDEVFGRRLATVTAGAGFGKSTLLSDWSSDLSCAWYTVSEADEEPSTFARGIAEALARELPQVASVVRTASSGGRPETFGAVVGEELEKALGHDLILVLDDVHLISGEGGTASAKLLESVCRQAPPLLHLVLVSRAPPPFGIERLRGRGEVVSLDGPALAFTVDEVAALLRSWLDEEAAALARSLHDACSGWPVAVRLAVEALQSVAPRERGAALDRIRSREGPLFDYLAEEVFGRESDDVRRLISHVASLDRFTSGMCSELGLPGSLDLLEDLVSRGLLTRLEGGESWFALHALVREFALDRLFPGDAVIADVSRRAAAWLEAQGLLLEALQAYTAGGAHEDVQRLLWDRRHDLIEVGASGVIVASTGRLPSRFRTAHVELATAYAHGTRGETALALACLDRASSSFDPADPEFAWQLGNALFEAGMDDETFAALPEMSGLAPTWEEAMIATLRAFILCARGEVEDAREVATQALAAAHHLGDPTPEAEAHMVLALVERRLGDYPAAEVHLAVALDATKRDAGVIGVARAFAIRAGLLHEQGRYEEALVGFEDALRLSELAGYGSFHTQVLCRRGRTRLACGRLAEALADFKEAAEVHERRGSERVGDAYAGLGDVYRERGDCSLAAAAYERARAYYEDVPHSAELVAVLAGLARVVAEDEPDRAQQLAKRAAKLARHELRTGALLPAGWISLEHEPRAAASLAMGWLALLRDDTDAAADAGAGVFEQAIGRGDRATLAEALELRAASASDKTTRARLLEEALTTWRDLGSPVGAKRCELVLARGSSGPAARRAALATEEHLRSLGIRASTTAAGLLSTVPSASDASVAVETLGTFRVLRHGQPVKLGEWQSKKARELLKILVSRRGRPTTREFLIAALWPEEQVAKAENRLSVALSTIRSLLDSERTYEQAHFLSAREEGIRLELTHLVIDVEAFLEGAGAGLALWQEGRVEEARGVLMRVQGMYGGEFLGEERYKDWAVSLREEARNLYVAVTRRLAEDAAARGDHDSAVQHLLRILEQDPYDEQAHLAVVSSRTAAGRHGDARRAFAIYVARMDELGLESVSFPSSPMPAAPRTVG